MTSIIYTGPEGETTGGSGGGPEGPGAIQVALRSQGLLTLAFGLALGLACIGLFYLIELWGPANVRTFVTGMDLQWWHCFLFGLISGTITTAIYNLLVMRRLNLFGLDPRLD